MDSDWWNLAKRFLASILEGMESLKDYLRFSVVCDSWHTVPKGNVSKLEQNLGNHHIPLLLVPSKRRKSRTWSLYSILDGKFLESKILLPRYSRRFCGSSEGWIAMIDEKFVMTLYKTFTVNEGKSEAVIHLPPLLPLGEEVPEVTYDKNLYFEDYVHKVTTFTPDPITKPDDLICVVMYGEFYELAYIRPVKSLAWTRVTDMERVLFDDVVYHNDKFYTITCEGKVASFDIIDYSCESKLKLVAGKMPIINYKNYFCYKKYLVESCGELWQIQRYIGKGAPDIDINPVTKKFKVFKLSFDRQRWIEIKELGDIALFLGDNSSVSIIASKFGCPGNRIYFTQDKNTLPLGDRGPRDLGVYDFERGSTSHFNIDATIFSKMRRAPIWIVPALNRC